MKADEQILKCRDDKSPIIFSMAGDAKGDVPQFVLGNDSECSWLGEKETFGPDKLRPRIEPWLTALFQSEHLALLIGSGLTHAVHQLATGKALSGMSMADLFSKVKQIGDKGPKPSPELPGNDEPPAGKAKAAGK